MKKTFFTLALAALAMPVMADEEVQPITLTNPDASDFLWIPGSNASGITTSMSADNVQSFINAIPAGTDLVGWFGGTGQGYAQSSYNEIHITSDTSFTFCSRPALTGEYVMMGVALPGPAESVTLSFDADKYIGYALFAYDGTSVTEIMPKAVTNSDKTSGASISVTKDFAEGAELAPSTLLVVWSSKPNNATSVGGGATITVSNIKVEYVPEPATATLSLLALAALAARRKRH